MRGKERGREERGREGKRGGEEEENGEGSEGKRGERRKKVGREARGEEYGGGGGDRCLQCNYTCMAHCCTRPSLRVEVLWLLNECVINRSSMTTQSICTM